MDRLIRKSLSAQARRSSEPCVNENLMAAYLERRLTPEEQRTVESHVADCPSCQEVLALALRLQSEEDSASPQASSTRSKKVLFNLSIPIPALGALLICIVIGALFFRWPHPKRETAVKEQPVAELHSPAQPAAQPPYPAATSSDASKEVRMEALIDEMRTKEARAENKTTIPPVAQSAASPRFDGLDSIKGISREKIPQKNAAGSPAPVLAGTVTTAPAQAANEPSTARDEVGTASRAVPTALAMTALPAGGGAGAENDLQAKKAESAGPKAIDTGSVLLSQSADTTTTGRGEAATVPPTVPSSLTTAALQTGAVSGGEQNLQGKMAAGKPEHSTPEQPAEAIVLARTQQPVTRPHLYAASNRIATSLYETESVETSLQFAIKNLSANLKKAESRKIGDRVFYKHRGFSIDGQCAKHAENPIVSITVQDPEYKSILEKYPEIISILPAAIYWDAKIYLLK
jgi:hypothetical protein